MTVSGVRRSCRTSASSCRWAWRVASTSAAMALNAALASATSRGPEVGSASGTRPAATVPEAGASRAGGR